MTILAKLSLAILSRSLFSFFLLHLIKVLLFLQKLRQLVVEHRGQLVFDESEPPPAPESSRGGGAAGSRTPARRRGGLAMEDSVRQTPPPPDRLGPLADGNVLHSCRFGVPCSDTGLIFRAALTRDQDALMTVNEHHDHTKFFKINFLELTRPLPIFLWSDLWSQSFGL